MTVQEPIACHPENTFTLLMTPAKVLLPPVTAGLNVSARLTVRLLPEPDTEEAPAFRVHWLLVRVPGTPNAAPDPTNAPPPSTTNCKTLVARV